LLHSPGVGFFSSERLKKEQFLHTHTRGLTRQALNGNATHFLRSYNYDKTTTAAVLESDEQNESFDIEGKEWETHHDIFYFYIHSLSKEKWIIKRSN